MNISNSVVPKNKIIITDNGKKYKKASLARTAAAIFIANTVGGATNMFTNKLSHIPINNLMNGLSQSDKNTFKEAGDKAFSISNLAQKGVKITDVTKENYGNIIKTKKKELPQWLNTFPKLKKVYENLNIIKIKMVLNGDNAFYNDQRNEILINKANRSISIFHEMGHALNKNNGRISKVLQKLRSPMGVIASVSIFTALLKRKKADGEKPEGFFDKTTTFIKENAGKLTFAGILPTLLEEGLASLKGEKLAKLVLSPENLKKIKKHNLYCYFTYLGFAIGTALTAVAMSKVRDEIAVPKEITA